MSKLSDTPFQEYRQKNPNVRARRIEPGEIDYIRSVLPTRTKHWSDNDMLEGYVMDYGEGEISIHKKRIFEAIFELNEKTA